MGSEEEESSEIEVIEGVKTDASESEDEKAEPHEGDVKEIKQDEDQNEVNNNNVVTPEERKAQDWRSFVKFCPNVLCFVLIICLFQYAIGLSSDIKMLKAEVSQLSQQVLELEQEISHSKTSQLVTEQEKTTELHENVANEGNNFVTTDTAYEIKSDEIEPERSDFHEKLRSIFQSLDEELASFKLGRQTVNVSQELKSKKRRKKLLKKPKSDFFEKNDFKSFKTKFKTRTKRAGKFEL